LQRASATTKTLSHASTLGKRARHSSRTCPTIRGIGHRADQASRQLRGKRRNGFLPYAAHSSCVPTLRSTPLIVRWSTWCKNKSAWPFNDNGRCGIAKSNARHCAFAMKNATGSSDAWVRSRLTVRTAASCVQVPALASFLSLLSSRRSQRCRPQRLLKRRGPLVALSTAVRRAQPNIQSIGAVLKGRQLYQAARE